MKRSVVEALRRRAIELARAASMELRNIAEGRKSMFETASEAPRAAALPRQQMTSTQRIWADAKFLGVADLDHLIWLSSDTVSTGLLPSEQAKDSFIGLITRHPTRRAAIDGLNDTQLVSLYRSLSAVPLSLRSSSLVLDLLDIVNAAAMKRLKTFEVRDVVGMCKAFPSLQIGAIRPSTPQLLVAMTNAWLPLLETMASSEAKPFLQTVSSQLTKLQCRPFIHLIDVKMVFVELKKFLPKVHLCRKMFPVVLSTYAKLFESGLPLSDDFVPMLKIFVDKCVKTGVASTHEVLRCLATVSRVRFYTNSSMAEDEAQCMLDYCIHDLENYEPVEMVMLMQCVASNFHERIELSGGTPSIPFGNYNPTTKGAKDTLLLDRFCQQLLPQIPSLSPRGFLTLARSAEQIGFTNGVRWDTRFCEAMAKRAQSLLQDHQLMHKSCRELLSFLSAGGPFFSCSAASRQTFQCCVEGLLESHGDEIEGSELSIMMAAFASCYGTPIGDELSALAATQGQGPLPDPPFVHEIDPLLFETLLQRLVLSSRLSHFALAQCLRSFLRLGIPFDEIRGVVRKILTLRSDADMYDAAIESLDGAQQHSSSLLHDVAYTEARDATLKTEAEDFSWSTRRNRHFSVFSPQQCAMVLRYLAGLRCSDPAVVHFVIDLVKETHDGAIPDDLKVYANVLEQVAVCGGTQREGM